MKKVGDQVAADETIAEIETDKTNLSVNSEQAGTVEALLVADGDNVTSGAQVAKLSTGGGGGGGGAKAKPTAAIPGECLSFRWPPGLIDRCCLSSR